MSSNIKIAGVDIAALVDQAFVDAGGVNGGVAATLHKRCAGTRTPGNLTGGVNPTFVDYSCRAFLERKTDIRIADTLVSQDGDRLSIFGNSIHPITPETGDEVTIENQRFTVTRIRSRDPAAALYVCDVTV